MIYFLFFLSGISGLIYQVVWVRVFGNVFGNTIYSASIVVAVFMLGLGVGSYVVGAWADGRYARLRSSDTRGGAAGSAGQPLLHAYGTFELAIAAMGFAIAALLPHLGVVSAMVSAYTREPSGWYVLSAASYFARAGIAVALLTPITVLMGGTLTLLIRHLVRTDLTIGGWRIAVLYGINTAGAALGAVVTDFSLVPAAGLWGAQMVGVGCNLLAGAGAWYLARASQSVLPKPVTAASKEHRKAARSRRVRVQPDTTGADQAAIVETDGGSRAILLTSIALAMTGMAALGLEILWFRHFNILLGGFRAVFSLLLALILLGIGLGSLIGGIVFRRTGRPAEWLMVAQALLVASTFFGFAAADVNAINNDPAGGPVDPLDPLRSTAPAVGALAELWFNAKPMLGEIVIPALLMGVSFPLANAMIQHAERSVGRRAGILYFANTIGAVCGSLIAGFVLLPTFGLQLSTTILMGIAASSIVPLYFAARPPLRTFAGALIVAAAAFGLWLLLPSDHVTMRALGRTAEGERRVLVSDGLTELIAVADASGRGRTLYTNGHAMSSTLPLSQRYMRALAHIPLLSIDSPESVLVIGFGVGNTTHAATLHPTVQRVEVADLSRDILNHAEYFNDANKGVLSHPKVAVHINDGRQHLQMQPDGSYDLIVLEPPPISYAGVSALYSREFYALARTRLKPNGYVSQWLPSYQVPSETALAMVRAFVDVFPQAVLLSGAESDLILLGTREERIEIDPDHVARVLAASPELRADLERMSFGKVHEIVGSFVGSARTLADATRGVEPTRDDRPLQEYGVKSMLSIGYGVPAGIVDLRGVAEWCPRCYRDGRPAPVVEELDTYFELLKLAYDASREEIARARRMFDSEGRTIAGSAYLGAIVPETAHTHNVVGLAHAQNGELDLAMEEFRRALELDPNDAAAHWHMGAALASMRRYAEATAHLARSVELDPANGQVHNDLGVLFALQGRLDESIDHLERAVALDPEYDEARRNLAQARQQRERAARQP